MKIACSAVLLLLPCAVYAKDPDKRLATVKTAWIEAVDELGDDRPIVACLIEHLPKTTPLTVASSKDAADVILRVSAHLNGVISAFTNPR